MLVRQIPEHKDSPEVLLITAVSYDGGITLEMGDNISVSENNDYGRFEAQQAMKRITQISPDTKFFASVLNMN